MVNRWTKWLAWSGCALLVIAAFFHGTGFTDASRVSSDAASDPFTKMFLEPLWIFPILSWLIVAIIAGYLATKPNRSHQIILLAISLIPIAHAITLFVFTGPFVGAFALAVAGGLFFIGAISSLGKAKP
jgi:hypothetical protein